MDSKQKYIKNKYWKKKYQPRNATATSANKKTNNKVKNGDLSEESEDECSLKQPIPKEGWFPESDSSEGSDPEDFTNILGQSTDKDKQCDKNWFEKELDSIQLVVPTNKENINIEQNDNESTFQETVQNKHKPSSLKIKNDTIKKVIKDNTAHNDHEEEELEFLLSLKEPVYTGPVVVKKDIESDRRLLSNNRTEQKPVKSIDLEKWLDSVLDD